MNDVLKKLVIQIHPDRLKNVDVDDIVREFRFLGAKFGPNEPVVRRAEESGGFINIEFPTADIEEFWNLIKTRFLSRHPNASAISRAMVVVATGDVGWSDYQLLHHYDPHEETGSHDAQLGANNSEEVLLAIREALKQISDPRFYASERGFQGELLAELRQRLPGIEVAEGTIVEQEYQKTLGRHGIKIRPDIIIHIPTAPGGDRTKGNYAAIELKLSANPSKVNSAFTNLDLLMERLAYPLGIFVNVASIQTFAQLYKGPFRSRLHCFAVSRAKRGLRIRHSYFKDGQLVHE